MNTPTTNNRAVENAVKLVGEAFLPGASLLVDGNILAGAGHLIVGVLAAATVGPVGAVLVMANSYANSTTGKGLLKQLKAEEPKSEGRIEVAKA